MNAVLAPGLIWATVLTLTAVVFVGAWVAIERPVRPRRRRLAWL